MHCPRNGCESRYIHCGQNRIESFVEGNSVQFSFVRSDTRWIICVEWPTTLPLLEMIHSQIPFYRVPHHTPAVRQREAPASPWLETQPEVATGNMESIKWPFGKVGQF